MKIWLNEFLNVFPVEDLWGIGRKNAKRLKEVGIHTACFRETDTHWIKRNLSINGLKLQKELKGEICYPLKLTTQRKKNICTSRSFGNEIKELKKIKREAVSSHVILVLLNLEKRKACCSTVGVFLNTNPFLNQNQNNIIHIKCLDWMFLQMTVLKLLNLL